MIFADLKDISSVCWIMAVGNQLRDLFDKISGDFQLAFVTPVRKYIRLVWYINGRSVGLRSIKKS